MAEIEASGSDENALPKIKLLAYAGSPMHPSGWYEAAPLVLDISGMSRGATVPILRGHDAERVVGHSTAIRGGSKITVEGLASGADTHVADVVQSSRRGFPWKASVGFSVRGRSLDFIGEGQRVVVNGRKHVGPVYIARKWELKEVSFVAIGADPHTSGLAANERGDVMGFEAWAADRGFVVAELEVGAVAFLRAQYDAEMAAADGQNSGGPEEQGQTEEGDEEDSGGSARQGASLAPALTAADVQTVASQAVAQALTRQATIHRHLAAYPDEAAQAVRESWDDTRIVQVGELLRLRATYSQGPAIHGSAAPTMSERSRQIEAAMVLSAMPSEERSIVAMYGAQTVEAARRTVPQSAGLKYLVHQTIRAAGRYADPGICDGDTIRAAFQADRELRAASGGFSTVSLSGILSNLANKALLGAYQSVPSVIRLFCRTVGHSDFKVHTKYRMIGVGDLQEVGPTGEITHTELDEDSYTNAVKTRARMIALTYQMIRNDDLGAFLQIPQAFGRMAAQTLEKSVFTLLLDNADSFFNSAASGVYRANALAAGASSALSVVSLGQAETLFYNQVDRAGNPIDLIPSVLLVSSSKFRDAVNLVNRTTVTVAGDPTSVVTEQLRIGNEFFGEFNPVKSPWINNTTIPGNSNNKWFLLASPSADVAVMEVAFLDNRQTPVIESAETDFNTLGMQWRTHYHWGVAKQDRRAGVYSPGA